MNYCYYYKLRYNSNYMYFKIIISKKVKYDFYLHRLTCLRLFIFKANILLYQNHFHVLSDHNNNVVLGNS